MCKPLTPWSEALGQLGQDEPASGMALEPVVAFAPISGSVAIALHHRNSDMDHDPNPLQQVEDVSWKGNLNPGVWVQKRWTLIQNLIPI